MENKIELLAPGGDIESIKAAIIAGADAIYCGLDRFNARNRATNISFEELLSLLRIAHNYNCKIFLTLNIIVLEHEIKGVVTLLNKLVNTSLDGIIIQDLGLFYILKKYYPTLEVHVSTQATTHNEGQILFLNKFNIDRINLSRELSLKEITHLTKVSHEKSISTEIFVHGSNCICFSGICYMSSVNGGNSGNRGRCSQPCRSKYKTTSVGVNHPLNIKDNSAYFDLEEIYKTTVDSIKVEGRIKKYHYVYTIIDSWRKQLRRFYDGKKLIEDRDSLYKVFNRDFSNHFLKGKITKDIFIDNPRNNSFNYFIKKNNAKYEVEIENIKQNLLKDKKIEQKSIKDRIDKIIIKKISLNIAFIGKVNDKLRVVVKSLDKNFEIVSKSNLFLGKKHTLDKSRIWKLLKSLNNEEFEIETVNFDNLEKNLFISFKELENIKKEILFLLNDSKKRVPAVDFSFIKQDSFSKKGHASMLLDNKSVGLVSTQDENLNIKKRQGTAMSLQMIPSLSILISSEKDLEFCNNSHEIFFQIPDSLNGKYNYLVTLFKKHSTLIPYFSSILISNDYSLAIKFLDEINPKLIVTNNTGIAFHAYKKDIAWIAGPFLNITNSYSLISLKENFNCYGAFISNEINKNQIKKISNPKNLKLYYSIYHTILVMTTRECLFHQVTGCEKNIVDNSCIKLCNKSTTITNLDGSKYYINKTAGNNHRIYNDIKFLNLDIVNDIPNKFSSFLIDLRDIEIKTKVNISKRKLIKLFEEVLSGNIDAQKELRKGTSDYTNNQYKKGL